MDDSPRPAADDRPRTFAAARIARALLFGCIVLASYPVRSYPITSGLDASWAFALNYAHAHGLIFGRDVMFTYGPLAWLAVPMDVGGNLLPALVFQTICWLVFNGIVAWFVFARTTEVWKVTVFAACLLAGWRSFHHWDYVGPEVFVAFLALLLLGGAATERRWVYFFASSWVLGLILLLVKFSAGIMVVSAGLLFSLALGVFDRRKAVRAALAVLLGTGLVLGMSRLLYFPSASDLVRYARAGLEISSGYSAAMSDGGPRGPLILALALMVTWLPLTVCLLRNRDAASSLAFAFLGPWFVLFKHSFVREAFHAGMIFAFAPLLWGIVVLFSDLRRWDLPRIAPAVAGFGAILCLTIAPATDPTRAPLAVDRLPEPILAAIGAQPAGVFPLESAYVPANHLNFRPFPVLQSYSAYTTFLDKTDAAFVDDDATAPGRVLFDWQSTDRRHPLLDAPATGIALYRHYDLETAAGNHLVLRRRAVARFGAPRLLETREWRWGRPFAIPESRHLLIARIHLERTAEGSLRSFFFRLPAVTLMDFRISPEVMQDGVPLNFLPCNGDGARALFSGGVLPSCRNALQLGGPGARFFRDPVIIDVLEIPEINR